MTLEPTKTGPACERDPERGLDVEPEADRGASGEGNDPDRGASELARDRVSLNEWPTPFRPCPPRGFGQR